MDAIDFFVLQYERLHRQVERNFLQRLSDTQLRCRPHGLNSIACSSGTWPGVRIR
jgi:hypothetical protein